MQELEWLIGQPCRMSLAAIGRDKWAPGIEINYCAPELFPPKCELVPEDDAATSRPASAASHSRASTATCRSTSRRDHEESAPGVKTSYLLRLVIHKQLSPPFRAGKAPKPCLSRIRIEAFGSCVGTALRKSGTRCRNNGIGCRCFIGLRLRGHDGLQRILLNPA